MANYEENRIIASSLTYAYPDAEKNAVENVTMRVKKGEFLAILGHNGSGKSTLAKLFNALYVPTAGTVWDLPRAIPPPRSGRDCVRSG